MRQRAVRGGAGERGTVTAEVAVALPALVLLLAALLGAAAVGVTQLRLEEAARAGAREIQRGEPPGSVEATVLRLAGDDAELSVSAGAGWDSITVSSPVPGHFPGISEIRLSATAESRSENG